MKVFLDDERPTPEGWVRTVNSGDTIKLLSTGNVEEISLDHDLGDDDNLGTGYNVLLWIELNVHLFGFKPPIIHIHTANTSARIKMEQALVSINKKWQELQLLNRGD